MLFRFYLICLCSILTLPLLAQQDSAAVLTLESYLGIVKKYHPVAKQADLLTEQAKANLRIARGGFDPLLYSEFDRKEFFGKNYYSFFSSELKIPSWYGIEVKTGYDVAYGLNVNPENNLPENGIYYLGVSVPVLKNLLMDKRRSDLLKARLFMQSSEQERLWMLNTLLLDAIQSYYYWSEAQQIKSVYGAAIELAFTRYRATVRAYELGDRAAIDTTEALAQYQQRVFQFNDADLTVQKARLLVSRFLWLEDNSSYTLPESVVPESVDSTFIQPSLGSSLEKLDVLLAQIDSRHPVINQYELKLKELNVERRLKTELLKPTLNVNYNLLSPGFFNYTSPDSRVFTNYYKFGFNFSMPLTFAQGRGELQQTKLKIKETQLQFSEKRRELEVKLMSTYAELTVLKGQIELYRETLNNYQRLLSGESRRFDIGESNLFLVNTRENTYISAEQKLIELQIKYALTEASLKWIIAALLV
jgi:outer membrane protein TolC